MYAMNFSERNKAYKLPVELTNQLEHSRARLAVWELKAPRVIDLNPPA